MPHDIRGKLLQNGDRVLIPAIVTNVHSTSEDYCNVNVRLALDMPPNDTETVVTLNARQVAKVGHLFLRGDDGAPEVELFPGDEPSRVATPEFDPTNQPG